MRTLLTLMVCLGLVLASTNSTAAQPYTTAQLKNIAERSIVHIRAPIFGDDGQLRYLLSSGVVISTRGHVLMACHGAPPLEIGQVQANTDGLGSDIARQTEILGSIGNENNFRRMELFGDGCIGDLQLVKFVESPRRSNIATPICWGHDINEFADLVGFGFPHKETSFVLADVKVSHDNATDLSTSGGHWTVTSSFTNGMSGGPVYAPNSGKLVGVIQGGSSARVTRGKQSLDSRELRIPIQALQRVIPINFAKPLIDQIGSQASVDVCVSTSMQSENPIADCEAIESAYQNTIRRSDRGETVIAWLKSNLTDEVSQACPVSRARIMQSVEDRFYGTIRYTSEWGDVQVSLPEAFYDMRAKGAPIWQYLFFYIEPIESDKARYVSVVSNFAPGLCQVGHVLSCLLAAKENYWQFKIFTTASRNWLKIACDLGGRIGCTSYAISLRRTTLHGADAPEPSNANNREAYKYFKFACNVHGEINGCIGQNILLVNGFGDQEDRNNHGRLDEARDFMSILCELEAGSGEENRGFELPIQAGCSDV